MIEAKILQPHNIDDAHEKSINSSICDATKMSLVDLIKCRNLSCKTKEQHDQAG